MGIFLMPFALLLKFFYDFFQSYGIALILFALIIKLVLFPFSLKGKRSMIQMNLLSGKMQQLQKQYGKDRERYNLEVQKLYEKEKVNPMSGCLWSFIPILFLMVLYGIIQSSRAFIPRSPGVGRSPASASAAKSCVPARHSCRKSPGSWPPPQCHSPAEAGSHWCGRAPGYGGGRGCASPR